MENSVSIFGIKTLAGALKTIGGRPLFPKKGGLGPLFVFSKKEFPRNLKKLFPPKLTVQHHRQKIPIPAVSDTG